jgi:hypothetical protein
MASEDSDELVPGLAMVHRLRDRRDLDQSLPGQVSINGDDLHTPSEGLEVVLLRGPQWMVLEERNDRLQQISSATYGVLAEVLPMVVTPPVHIDTPNPEEALELLEADAAALTLGYDEPVEHLVAGCVASSPRAAWLPHEADREASFSVYETDHPATELDHSFLLIFRTRHVVTMVNVRSDVTR